MTDRYKLDLFYQEHNHESKYTRIQDITDDVYNLEEFKIFTLAMDFPSGTTTKHRKQLEKKWIDLLPGLDHVKGLSVRHRVNQDFFEAICRMKNLQRLFFWISPVEDISSIVKLQKLMCLRIAAFSNLSDLSPLIKLKRLALLSVEKSFKINFDSISEIRELIGLELSGDRFAPKTLKLKSLKPFTALKKLRHLDLTCVSVLDKSYESILEMTSLERFDMETNIPLAAREKIKANHKTLKAGFFMDWDFENKKFYEGKTWPF